VSKRFSVWLLAIGVLFVVIAIVLWTAVAPVLTKLPNDVNTSMEFEGTMTLYVNPQTGEFLPPGQEMALPLEVIRTFKSVDYQYTSGVAVFEDTLLLDIEGMAPSTQVSSYALDRKTRKCVESDLNWAYDPSIILDGRVGFYGPLFPGGLEVGDVREAFFNDPSLPFEAEVVEEIADWNGLGITAMKIDASREEAPYNPVISQAVLVQGLGLPTEMSFDQFAAAMAAKGLDLNTLMAALQDVVTAEEMQALMAMTQQPVPLVYGQYSGDVLYIEKTSGATVGATFDRTTTVGPDPAVLTQMAGVLMNYMEDPTVGPAIQAAMGAVGGEPTKVYNQTMSITSKSQSLLADDADDKAAMIKLANLWIPLAVVLVGAVMILLGGAVLIARKVK